MAKKSSSRSTKPKTAKKNFDKLGISFADFEMLRQSLKPANIYSADDLKTMIKGYITIMQLMFELDEEEQTGILAIFMLLSKPEVSEGHKEAALDLATHTILGTANSSQKETLKAMSAIGEEFMMGDEGEFKLNSSYETFGEMLHDLMDEREVSLDQLAKYSNVSKSRLNQLLKGQHEPTTEEVELILEALEIEYDKK